MAVFMAIGVVDAVRESRRAECANHLKRIGLAMHNYMSAHQDYLPPPYLASRDGRPLLSWRVALLPHLGYRSLYERFRLDEPWDSPHNRVLLAEMPPEFACPGGPGLRSGRTSYLVIVGPEAEATSVNTPFEPTRSVELREFVDGTSNTILVMETTTPVPWTKPDDLRWAPDGPLPRVASPHPDGANMLFGDGAVKFIRPAIRPEILRGALTINGGETISGGAG
jgi:prepilin-type processing-associated H-X9-DG protein